MLSLRPRSSCSLPCHLRLRLSSLFSALGPWHLAAGWLAASLIRAARFFRSESHGHVMRPPTSAMTRKTNENGDFDFVDVPVGTYRLEFDLTGFKKNVRRGMSLDINQVITLNMTMQLGATRKSWTSLPKLPWSRPAARSLGQS